MISVSEMDTLQFGKGFAQTLPKGAIIALHGDLGAGKTTLVKGVIRELLGNPTLPIPSPTFTYVHSYETPAMTVHHFDLYRLKNAQNFLEMGFSDYFDGEGICFVEWPDRIFDLLPKETIHIELIHLENEQRRIDVRKN